MNVDEERMKTMGFEQLSKMKGLPFLEDTEIA
jgi:hypothetical protein